MNMAELIERFRQADTGRDRLAELREERQRLTDRQAGLEELTHVDRLIAQAELREQARDFALDQMKAAAAGLNQLHRIRQTLVDDCPDDAIGQAIGTLRGQKTTLCNERAKLTAEIASERKRGATDEEIAGLEFLLEGNRVELDQLLQAIDGLRARSTLQTPHTES